MSVPVPVLGALDVFGQIIRAEMNTKREKEITKRANHMASLQASLASERIAAQKDILILLIKTAQHVFDRKMDLIQSSFESAMELIRTHQEALIAEKEGLKQASLKQLDKMEYLLMRERINDIDGALLELDHRAMVLNKDIQAMVQSMSLDVSGRAAMIGNI